MTNKEKIKYLSQYPKLELEYKLAYNKYIELQEKFDFPASGVQHLSQTPVANCSGNPIQDEYFRLLTFHEILQTTREKMDKIKDIIFTLDDSMHRIVMRLRYIENMTWENICVQINYQWAWTHKLHSCALEKIEIK